MAEPITEDALQLIVSLLQAIHTDDGYFTDLGAGLITTEPLQAPADDVPYTVVTDTVFTTTTETKRAVVGTLEFVIEFIVPCGGTQRKPANLARRGRADIVRALKAPLRGLLPGLRALTVSQTQRLILDDARYANSVVGQVSGRADLSESIPPATP